MDTGTREAFLLWAGQPEFAKKVEEAERITGSAVKDAGEGRSYVAFSGGKDSTAMLHLVLRHDPSALCVHWDYGPFYIPRPLEAEMLSIASRCGAANVRVLTSPSYARLGRSAKNVLGREFIGREVPKLRREGYSVAFVGLRAEESVKRRLRVGKEREYAGIREVYPIAEWSYRDVWAYILSRNLPYLSTYDLYAPVVGWDKVRMVTFFDPEFQHLGNQNIDGVLMWRFRHADLHHGGVQQP